MKGFELIARSVAEAGIGTVFGVAGDANLYIIDDLVRSRGVRYIPTAHEAAAVMAAIGFARASDGLGTATVTNGPGLTNTFTALVEGVRSHTAVVLLAGDTDLTDGSHPQNINQRAIVDAAGAGFEQVRGLLTAGEDIARAVWRARVDQRPIVLSVPSHLQWAEGDCEPSSITWPQRQCGGPDPDALDRALGIIASANRPLVLAGRGAIGARGPLLQLAECLGAPVATTLLGAGLFRGASFDLGVFGTLSHPVAAEVITDADCIVAFGASLSTHTTDGGRMLNDKRLVQCDISADRFGRYPHPDAGIIGDAATTAETMVAWLTDIGHRPSAACTAELGERLAAGAWREDYTDRGTTETVDPRTLTIALDRALPAERTIAVDYGRFMLFGLRMSIPEPTALVTTHGFASIGLGTAAAVGAGIARPDRPVVLLVGDGGFMMGGLAELQTAVRSGIDLVAVVYNDSSYGAEHVQFCSKGLDARTSLNNWPDFAVVADAMGADGISVRSNEDLEQMAKAIVGRRRPLLINAYLDPDVLSTQMS